MQALATLTWGTGPRELCGQRPYTAGSCGMWRILQVTEAFTRVAGMLGEWEATEVRTAVREEFAAGEDEFWKVTSGRARPAPSRRGPSGGRPFGLAGWPRICLFSGELDPIPCYKKGPGLNDAWLLSIAGGSISWSGGLCSSRAPAQHGP